MNPIFVGAMCALSLAACGSNTAGSGASTDTATNFFDEFEPDLAVVADAGANDGAANDAVGPDGGASDAHVADTAPIDAVVADAGTGDQTGELMLADGAVGDADSKDIAPVDTAGKDSDGDAVNGVEITPADVMASDSSSNCAGAAPKNTVCEGTIWVCAEGYFKGYGKSECIEANCDNLIKEVWAAIDDMVGKSKACSQDDDCVIASTSTSCQGSCGAAVNGGMQNDVMKIVGWVDDNLCKKYGYAAKCGFATPKCMAPAPTCVAGKCQYNKTVP